MLLLLSQKAVKVVVQPWRGRHHVYGIFLLPHGYHPRNLVVMGFRNLGFICLSAKPDFKDLSRISIPKGYYPIKVYIKTRYVICLILLGWSKRLKKPENWLVYCYSNSLTKHK